MKTHKGGILFTTVFLVSAIVFASGAIAVYTVFMKPEGKSEVPDFRDKSTLDAVSEAERLGLVVQLEQTASSLPDGRVLAQSPQAGTELRKGQVIVLQVSKGGELHPVPDVKGMTLQEAQNEIKASGFTVGDIIKIREPKVKAGSVIAQSPSSPSETSAGRKIDLLVQDSAGNDEIVTVPNVNKMTEKEAREAITSIGLKIHGVDRVYSPLLEEGTAIETRPGAGSTMRAGQGIILKIASQRRPAGYMGSDSKTTPNQNGTARRVTSQKDSDKPKSSSSSSAEKSKPSEPKNVSEKAPPQSEPEEEEFIGDDYAAAPSTPSAPSAPSKPAQTSQPSQTSETSQPAQSSGSKTANIRYIVPPIAKPMNLRIEVTDPSGKREIMNRQVRSGESISAAARYSNECIVTIYLGGESVWQERKN